MLLRVVFVLRVLLRVVFVLRVLLRVVLWGVFALRSIRGLRA